MRALRLSSRSGTVAVHTILANVSSASKTDISGIYQMDVERLSLNSESLGRFPAIPLTRKKSAERVGTLGINFVTVVFNSALHETKECVILANTCYVPITAAV